MAFKLLICLILNGLILTQASPADRHGHSENVMEIVAQLLSSDQLQEENADSAETESVCTLPSVTGPCRAAIRSYYFNSKTGRCEQFIYGGCRGNGNRFPTKQKCEQTCGKENSICTLPSVTGPCRAYFPSYYFNSKTGQCEQFIYGGCRGNGNRFPTKQKCEQTCSSSICTLPPETGPCRAYIPSYYFNSKTGRCERFIYGGCGGNGNRFPTLEKCKQTCGKELTVIEGWTTVEDESSDERPKYCYLPSEHGPCSGYFPRYYYDPTKRCCGQFIYGGCVGNQNNFEDFQECNSECHSICL